MRAETGHLTVCLVGSVAQVPVMMAVEQQSSWGLSIFSSLFFVFPPCANSHTHQAQKQIKRSERVFLTWRTSCSNCWQGATVLTPHSAQCVRQHQTACPHMLILAKWALHHVCLLIFVMQAPHPQQISSRPHGGCGTANTGGPVQWCHWLSLCHVGQAVEVMEFAGRQLQTSDPRKNAQS